MFGLLNQPHSAPTVTSQPSDQSTAPKFNLLFTLEKELANIPQQMIQALCFKLYPVQTSTPNVYHSLYRQLMNFFGLQLNKGNTYQSIVGDALKYASAINQVLCIKLGEIFRKEQVKSKLLENAKKIIGAANNTIANTNSTNSINLQNINNKKLQTGPSLLENLSNRTGGDSNKYVNLLNKQLNETFKKDSSPQHININNIDNSANIAQKYMKERLQVQNMLNKIAFQKQLTSFDRIINKKCLICQNLLTMNGNDKNIFKCKDCGEMFHKKCMSRQNNCIFCQLKYINPLQKVKTPLFVGILKKGIKKHDIQFEINKCHLQSQQNENEKNNKSSSNTNKNLSSIPSIQIRSIRIKQINDSVANYINLFPDACTIMINNRLIKQFQPLHKQSSLKYRRDECIKISSNVTVGINKLMITQRILKKDIKPDQRIQPQNHLIGVYIVDNLQVPKPANKLQQFLNKSGYITNNGPVGIQKFLQALQCKISTYQQSQKLLKQSMLIGENTILKNMQQQQQIVCDSIKVPLNCSLTLQKMKYPGRTIFCKHFTCFDVYNFILLNAQAKLPKWQCPICKSAAYKFQIDCVMNSVITQIQKIIETKKSVNNQNIKETQQAYQIQFDKNLNTRLINSEGNILISKKSLIKRNPNQQYLQTDFVPYWLSNIADLPIEGKHKRIKEDSQIQNKKSNKIDNQGIKQMSYSIKKGNREIEREILQKPVTKMNEEKIKASSEKIININDSLKNLQAQQEQALIAPFLIIQEGKMSPNKNNQQKNKNSEKRKSKQQQKMLNFEVRIEGFNKEVKQLKKRKQSSMHDQNSDLQKNSKQITLQNIIQNNNNNDKQSQKIFNQKIKNIQIINQDCSGKQQIRKLQINDESEHISEFFRKTDQKIISNEMVAEQNIRNKLFQEKQKQKQVEVEVQNIEQRKQVIHNIPASQSKSQRMSQQDPEMQKAIKQYEDALQRLKKVLKAGVDMPKVINIKNMNKQYQNKCKQKPQNNIFQNITPSPFKPEQQLEDLKLKQHKHSEHNNSQIFNASYQSVGADFQPINQQNFKVQLAEDKPQQFGYGEFDQEKDNVKSANLSQKSNKQKQFENKQINFGIFQNFENGENDDDEKGQNKRPTVAALEQTKKLKQVDEKKNDNNQREKFVDFQISSKNLQFTQKQKPSLNLFESYIPTKSTNTKQKKQGTKKTTTAKNAAPGRPKNKDKQKQKQKQKQKGQKFQMPLNIDVIQLSD